MTDVTFAVNNVSVPLGTEVVMHGNAASTGTSCGSCAQRHDKVTFVLQRFRFVLPLLLLVCGIEVNANTWSLRAFVW
jgi:hypothetical protein